MLFRKKFLGKAHSTPITTQAHATDFAGDFARKSGVGVAHESSGYLCGQLLVATPLIGNSVFQRSVILLFAHNEEGAMGLIINQPLESVHYASLLQPADLPQGDAPLPDMPVFFGGPVDRGRGFVLHSADYMGAEPVMREGNIAVTANTTILHDIGQGKGPKHFGLVVGYAGWAAGQLEAEIEQNSWITVPATDDLVFHTDDEMKWNMASQSLGIDMNFYSPIVGHA